LIILFLTRLGLAMELYACKGDGDACFPSAQTLSKSKAATQNLRGISDMKEKKMSETEERDER